MKGLGLAWFWILVVLVFVILTHSKCEASDTFYGVGIFGGEQWQQGLAHVSKTDNWQEFQVRPMIGKYLTDRWDVWLEGSLGCIKWNDGHSGVKLGALVMTDYNVIKYKGYRLFTEVGVGLGWTSHSPKMCLLRNNVLGLIDCGVGIQYKSIRIGPRFHHSSAIFAHDQGINTYGMMVTIRR